MLRPRVIFTDFYPLLQETTEQPPALYKRNPLKPAAARNLQPSDLPEIFVWPFHPRTQARRSDISFPQELPKTQRIILNDKKQHVLVQQTLKNTRKPTPEAQTPHGSLHNIRLHHLSFIFCLQQTNRHHSPNVHLIPILGLIRIASETEVGGGGLTLASSKTTDTHAELKRGRE